MRKSIQAALCSVVLGALGTAAAAEGPLYEMRFDNLSPGKLPAEFLVLDGGFSVKQDGTNHWLELPGSPLDNFAVQFGPSETENVVVSCRIAGTAHGRRYPTFGVGLNGVAGFRLQVSPAKHLLELFRDQEEKGSASFDWKSGTWNWLRLRVRKTGAEEWVIDAKAWVDGSEEPKSWMISVKEREAPIAGRSSVFGSPFSGTPIQFDDLKLERAAAGSGG